MAVMGVEIHNHYSVLPVIAAVTWFVTLLVLLITWLATGRPHYASQEGSIAFISDVGADFLKPLFVIGAGITSAFFILTLVAERSLSHQRRLLPAQRRSERILSYSAIGGATLGGLGLFLLSICDTMRFVTLHRVFLFVFMLGVALSAIFTVIEFRLLSHSYKDYTILRRSYVAKGSIAALLVALAIVFSVMLSRRNLAGLDAAGVIEWVIGFGFNLYLLTFWYDLRLAAPRNEIHKELNEGGVAAHVMRKDPLPV
ncbi:hypothetical protein M408DRAFT_330228 [Serendipita vermifera MAFF 305830]|uniref:CWH43-like N-terminal domain-containing protein n=1 Tax=Serendipita vermifera MAFF 305830 TaxID=933852 RepID=A0A0C2WLD2_SERVB|nr:hypothetical protein M408DRAFT_330228 [Serendipita vermifera MAFF 305830]